MNANEHAAVVQPVGRGSHYLSSDGLCLYYRDYPGDPGAVPVLCLPGLTRNSLDFADIAERIAPRHRVIAPDLRGRGQSNRDIQWQRYAPATYLDDLHVLLEQAGADSIVVIGTSLGGVLAMMTAKDGHVRVEGVVLNDIGPEIEPEGMARIKGYVGRRSAPADWDAAVAECRAIHGAELPDFSAADWERYARRCYREINGAIVPDFDPLIARAAIASQDALPDLWAAFDALHAIPALVLRGELSDVLSAATVARMAERKPDLECVEVPNRGHVPQLDEPVCVEAIDGFLRRFAAPHTDTSS